MLSSLNLHPPPNRHHFRRHNHHHRHSSATTLSHLNPLTRRPSPKSLTRLPSSEPPIVPLNSSSNHRNNSTSSSSPAVEFLRHLSVSSVFFLGVTLYAFSASSSTTTSAPPVSSPPIHEQQKQQEEDTQAFTGSDGVTDEELLEAFEKWKSISYALTVPLRVVTYRNSFPPVWIKHFLQSQGKRAKLKVDIRQSLQSIFDELSLPFTSGKISQKSALAADVVSLGDSWINFAISQGLIDPMLGIEEENWFKNLHEKWKVYLRRSSNGKLDPQGKIWAAPYRWGSMVIAYKKSEFVKRKLALIKDWEDLWRPELAGKIAMVDSSREVIGMVLKSMGASYNTENIDIQVSGGRDAVRQKLAQLVKQVRLFDSLHYLKAFAVGDTWVAVGWSADVLPAAKRMSNVTVVVPKCGASLWADFWAVPAASKISTDKIGGRMRGPSPLVYQWIEFCLQPHRVLHFRDEAIAGSSPISLSHPAEKPQQVKNRVANIETNLVASVPPPDILERCEFLEPLSEVAVSDYQWLVNGIQKEPGRSIIQQARDYFTSLVENYREKDQVKNA